MKLIKINQEHQTEEWKSIVEYYAMVNGFTATNVFVEPIVDSNNVGRLTYDDKQFKIGYELRENTLVDFLFTGDTNPYSFIVELVHQQYDFTTKQLYGFYAITGITTNKLTEKCNIQEFFKKHTK